MNPIIVEFLTKIELGEPRVFENMAVVALFTSLEGGPPYITLGEALEKRLLTITEVSQAGSVPELKVVNRADIPILLLDGEELEGAKQNRVLNTTILLKEGAETIIPVSCTEQGRWAYASREFEPSGNLMYKKARAKKVASVSRSLKDSLAYASNQREVWDELTYLAKDAQVFSPTQAMRDVFEAKEEELAVFLKAFPCLEDQKGILVIVNGKAVGFDILSRSQAYKQIHGKLVKSYAMDALFRKEKGTHSPIEREASRFIEEAKTCQEERYESVGYGWDHRFEGKTIVGSSLVYQDTVIHMAFFRAEETDRAGRISSPSRRRAFRFWEI
ncbi:MAG: hypothetical protein N3G78_10465 [Desulfobacterota bacterium]|nr:hypothetical protein [Thermodesulfobacteriota bacterium]